METIYKGFRILENNISLPKAYRFSIFSIQYDENPSIGESETIEGAKILIDQYIYDND